MLKKYYHLNNNLKLDSARNIILISVVLLTILAFVLQAFFLEKYVLLLLVPIFILVVVNFLFLHFLFKHVVQMKDDYSQLTEFIQLKEKIGNEITLPLSRGYAASPDFLNAVLDTIKATKPKRILEASCGISSISISEYLIKNNLTDVQHIALEHDELYWKKCSADIRNSNSEIKLAPIVEHQIDGKSWKWYDIQNIADFKDIDLFIIDGPPAYLQKNSRYPAVPLLIKQLSPNCVVLLDDSYRGQEQFILAEWTKQYGFTHEILWSEKGIGRMERK